MMWRSSLVGCALTAVALASGCSCCKHCRSSCAPPVVAAAPCCPAPAPAPAPCCTGPGPAAAAPVQSYSVPAFSNGYAH